MKLLSQTLAAGLIAILLVGCLDNDNATKVKEKENLQGLSSLEGTVWVHHPDTDPEAYNWFNLYHSPSLYTEKKLGHDVSYPVEISFLENGKIYEPTDSFHFQYYYYSYTEPYVTIGMFTFNSEPHSVAELQKSYNLCHLTIDDYRCDCSKCQFKDTSISTSIDQYRHRCKCTSFYWFLGKVYGDTMHLHKAFIGDDDEHVIYRDVYLIRRR